MVCYTAAGLGHTIIQEKKKLKFVFVFHTATYYVNHIYEKLTHTKLTYVSKQIAF